MKEQLIKKLNELVDGGKKKSALETEIGLPANSLSAVLGGHKEMPDKWVTKIQSYFTPIEPKKEVPEKTKMVVDNGGLKLKPVSMLATEEMNKINKDFGEGTIMFFGSKPNTDYKTISTGSLLLNEALGIGGLPRGRIVEIFGWESSGKTTIALNAIADAQKQGLKCLLVDAENAFDPEYAANLGVVVDELQYCQPSYGEQGLEVADRQMSSGKVDVVVIDSVAALVPKAELEGEHGDSKMGLHQE
jgi:recombination protein RecA